MTMTNVPPPPPPPPVCASDSDSGRRRNRHAAASLLHFHVDERVETPAQVIIARIKDKNASFESILL